MQRVWEKAIRSWWGRSLAGAFLGGLLVSWAGVQDPIVFIIGALLGAVAMYFLGMWE